MIMVDQSPWRKATVAEMQWWRDAKFGLFIHWGSAAIGGQDISWCRKDPERIGDHPTVAEPKIPADVFDRFYKPGGAAQELQALPGNAFVLACKAPMRVPRAMTSGKGNTRK